MMMPFTSHISILLFLVLSTTIFHISMSSNQKMVGCNEKDREILLIFKQGIIDRSNHLSMWSNEEDCCVWKGVQCDNNTGRVTKLNLKHPRLYGHFKRLKGELKLSLLELEFLSYLDLSWNNFDKISIPLFHDNVTLASNLHYLDLSWNHDLHMHNIHWLSRFSSLKYLNLSGIDLHKETNWLQLVTMLPSLLELHLSDCNLNYFSPSLKYVNFTSLVTLDLSCNNFNSKLPNWLFNLSNSMTNLDFSQNSIQGEIPSSLLNLPKLRFLDLSHNKLKGRIPQWFGQLEHLQSLDLSYNMFCHSIPSTLGNLSSLVFLSIASNSFSGSISETFFSKLSNLEYLNLGYSPISFHLDSKWIPPFQLIWLYLANTNQGPNFPSWIYTQNSLQSLDISSSGISLVDADMFRSFIAKDYRELDISNNSISEDLSNVTLNSTFLWLDHNNFTGGLPHILPKALQVDLSHNSFSGSIPYGWEYLKDLSFINLWSNKLFGEVLVNLSNLSQLLVLNLGKNEFSGAIPMMPQNLEVMILRSNQFEGNIPPQLFNLSSLYHMDLAYNKFSGSIPHCVYNMTQMIMNSNLTSYVPMTVDLFIKGQNYEYVCLNPDRRTIDLSVNNLSGEIPLELFELVQVQTLNLSHNHFTGAIQENIRGMKFLESLDLSNNKFSGEIPQVMADLSFLSYLNLSYNNFTGQIPIGTQLQSFDASSYIGNPKLCGAPLTRCVTKENYENAKNQTRKEDGDIERDSFYLGMGVGFAVGFWGICGSLFLIREWRHLYFRFLDTMVDQLVIF